MKTHSRTIRNLAILFAVTFTLPALAAFSDVPSTHSFAGHIQVLADMGIVKGNPDGTFAPGRTVNRAEMLTMLYRAANKTPMNPTKSCFKDVGTSSWFSGVVCDAAKSGYVGGYPDGNFRPEQQVNRVEALKMVHTVLGLRLDARMELSFSDVPVAAWFMPYVSSAYGHGVLPIATQEGAKFYPEWPLLRGEAAAYIFNALGLELPSSKSSSSRARSSSSTSSAGVFITNADFPFGDDGNFTDKIREVYAFTLSTSTTGQFKVTVDPENTVGCRLYKLDSATDFALEYYIGQEVGNECWMRVSMAAGEYQFEVLPGSDDISFDIETFTVSGDTNDGFREAQKLIKSQVKTGNLESNDHGEYYYFTLNGTTTMTVSVTNADKLKCLIFPMKDVDLYGFSGPVCNESYEFPKGTYYIGVTHRDNKTDEETFSVRYE